LIYSFNTIKPRRKCQKEQVQYQLEQGTFDILLGHGVDQIQKKLPWLIALAPFRLGVLFTA